MTNSINSKAEPSVSKLNFLKSVDEEKVAEWVSSYGKNTGYLLGGVLILLSLVYLISSSFSAKPEKEYLQAASDFSFFVKQNESQDNGLVTDAYKRLEAIMSKYPELHAAYDGILAQTFLNRQQTQDAKPYAQATLARTKSNHLEYYSDYATTTLLISEHKFQEALDTSKALQAKMTDALSTRNEKEMRTFGDELFALNLLRIGMLQQEMGDTTGELTTWQQWKQYAGLGSSKSNLKVDAQAFRALIQQLSIGAVSLPDYINYREKALNK